MRLTSMWITFPFSTNANGPPAAASGEASPNNKSVVDQAGQLAFSNHGDLIDQTGAVQREHNGRCHRHAWAANDAEAAQHHNVARLDPALLDRGQRPSSREWKMFARPVKRIVRSPTPPRRTIPPPGSKLPRTILMEGSVESGLSIVRTTRSSFTTTPANSSPRLLPVTVNAVRST